jgi:hypothetical protein
MSATRREGPCSLSWRYLGDLVSHYGPACLLNGETINMMTLVVPRLGDPSTYAAGWVPVDVSIGPGGVSWYWEIPIHEAPPLPPAPPTRVAGDHGTCNNCGNKLALPCPEFLCDNCRRLPCDA